MRGSRQGEASAFSAFRVNTAEALMGRFRVFGCAVYRNIATAKAFAIERVFLAGGKRELTSVSLVRN
jgi:hypothetical protein